MWDDRFALGQFDISRDGKSTIVKEVAMSFMIYNKILPTSTSGDDRLVRARSSLIFSSGCVGSLVDGCGDLLAGLFTLPLSLFVLPSTAYYGIETEMQGGLLSLWDLLKRIRSTCRMANYKRLQ